MAQICYQGQTAQEKLEEDILVEHAQRLRLADKLQVLTEDLI